MTPIFIMSSFPKVVVGNPLFVVDVAFRHGKSPNPARRTLAGRQTLGDNKTKRPLIKVVLEGQLDKSVLTQKGTA